MVEFQDVCYIENPGWTETAETQFSLNHFIIPITIHFLHYTSCSSYKLMKDKSLWFIVRQSSGTDTNQIISSD